MKDSKISLLLKDGRDLYHTQDLMVLWNVSNENTLYTSIKRYKQKGVLYPVYKGFYAVKPVEEIDSYLIGARALRRYGYLSTESVLSEDGIIMQELRQITFVSDFSKRFEVNNRSFVVRKMKDYFLNNKEGVFLKDGVWRATTERAVADLLYFNPSYHLDGASVIDWAKVSSIQKKIGYDNR